MLYPFAWIGNKWLGLSYKWVNVAYAAWHPELYNPIWHYQWFGDAIEEMPDKVNLCGTMYDVTVSEGLVQFVNREMVITRISFERDPHDKYAELWYCSYAGSFNKVPASDLERAYEWIKAVYGGSFEVKSTPL